MIMSVAVSAAMAGAAVSQASIAQASARKAQIEQCKFTMPNFDAQSATVSEMREYAHCVEIMHPNEIGAATIIALKVLFVVALAGMAFGAWKGRHDGFQDYALYGMLGFLFAPAILVFIVGLGLGVWWLFS